MTRTDTPLINHLRKTVGVEAAVVYNRLPLFLMPEESSDLMLHEAEILAAGPDTLPHPFDDFLIDFPYGTGAVNQAFSLKGLDRGRLWVRVRSFEAIRPDDPATTIERDQLDFLKTCSPGLFLEGWEQKTQYGGLPPYPDYSVMGTNRGAFDNYRTHLHCYPNPSCKKPRLFEDNLGWCNIRKCRHPGTEAYAGCLDSALIHAVTCRLVALSLVYLSENLGGMTTEIKWAPAPHSKEEKTERLKPWLSPRRRTYIIIDPERAGDYGHPSSYQPVEKGHHASPVPHARRGHWRRLDPDRRTWVRAAWVGATEWQHEGRTYKIIQRERRTLHDDEKGTN